MWILNSENRRKWPCVLDDRQQLVFINEICFGSTLNSPSPEREQEMSCFLCIWLIL